MAGVIRKTTPWKSRAPVEQVALDEWGYPTGMVWCPMKMSGMALMKCAEMQKELGCGSLKQFKILIHRQARQRTVLLALVAARARVSGAGR